MEIAQDVSGWLFSHLGVIALFSGAWIKTVFIRKFYWMLYQHIFMSLMLQTCPTLAATCSIILPHLCTLPWYISHPFHSAGQLLIPLSLPWLNFEIFPLYILFCFLFHHHFFGQVRNILDRIPTSAAAHPTQIWGHSGSFSRREGKGAMQLPELSARWWLLRFPSPKR